MLNEVEKYETKIAILDRIRHLERGQDAMPEYPHKDMNWYSEEINTLRGVLEKIK